MAKAHVYKRDHINTDEIIPARYLNTDDAAELAQHCMEDIDTDFMNKVQDGDVIVAGEDFGCGSSREQAASCLKGHNPVIVAKHFARIFITNAINLGLNVVICPDIDAEVGDELEMVGDILKNKTQKTEFATVPLPAAKQAVIDAGGLIAYTRARILAKS